MVFRFNAQRAFLTYAQCPLTPDQALAYLITNLQDVVIQQHAIGQETHQDGNFHLHAYLQFDRKFSTRNERAFDIIDEGTTYHPNIQSPRSVKAVIEYVTKDGNFIASPGITLPKKGWATIIDEATNKNDFLEKVKGSYPRDYVLSLERIEYAAGKLFPDEVAEYIPRFTPESFIIEEQMQQWLDQRMQQGKLRNPNQTLNSLIAHYRALRIPSLPRGPL